MRRWVLAFVAAMLLGFMGGAGAGLLTGCSAKQAEGAAKKIEQGANATKEAADSAPAKAVAAVAGPAGEVVRQGVKYGAEAVAAIAALIAGYCAKKSRERKKKNKVLRKHMTPSQQDKANQEIFGKKYKPELSGK